LVEKLKAEPSKRLREYITFKEYIEGVTHTHTHIAWPSTLNQIVVGMIYNGLYDNTLCVMHTANHVKTWTYTSSIVQLEVIA